ncbi:hypothetical protein ACI3PL_23525, partial [Lacticaseibacillus paracasei]
MIQWELDFTAQTYLFKPITDIEVIKKSIQRFYTNQDSYDSMTKIAPSAIDALPLNANHDFDAETAYAQGLIINDMVKITD